MEQKELLLELKNLLLDLKRCGIFYYSAIEIDHFVKNPIDGEIFEVKINELLEKLKDIKL